MPSWSLYGGGWEDVGENNNMVMHYILGVYNFWVQC